MRKQLLFIALLILSQIGYGQNDADVDTSFNIGTGFNGDVSSITLQSDGKILVGGIFTLYNETIAKNIIRLNTDGSIDSSFMINSNFINYPKIFSIVLQSDGKILVGGDFSYNGISGKHIVRLNNDGSLDTTFVIGSGFDSYVNSIVLQPDGKILIGGAFTLFNGVAVNRIIRLNSDGSKDTSFITNGFNSFVNSIVLQADGKILVGGDFLKKIARLNSTGNVDATFAMGTGFNSSVNSIVLQEDGKVLVGGSFTVFNGINAYRIIRLKIDGSNDSSFVTNNGFDNDVYSMALQKDGKILLRGIFSYYNSGSDTHGINRLSSDGSKDTSFVTNDLSFPNGNGGDIYYRFPIRFQSDGKILVGGGFNAFKNVTASKIVRLTGSPVLSLNKFGKKDFKIYPNPVKEFLNINIPDNDFVIEYSIYDISGKKITSNKLLENKIDVRSLPEGVYILKIKKDKKIFENKFIKE